MSGQIRGKGFALEGKKTPIWNKPGNFTNSELTIKPKKKSSQSLATSSARRHAQRPTTTLSGTSLNDISLGNSTINMGDSLYRKSVTFDKEALRDALQAEVDEKYAEILTGSRGLNDSGVGSLNGTLRSSPVIPAAAADETPWFTRRYHHTPSVPDGGPTSSQSPLGTLGVALASSCNLQSTDSTQSLDQLARDFFPLTLNAATFAKSIDAPVLTHLPSSSHIARGLPAPGSSSMPRKPPKRSRSPKRASREAWGPGGSSTISPPGLASQSLEKMYLRSTEAPATAAASVASVSPFQAELARLRMERLKLEEQHLLEIKRGEELERIRGPQPKWYEMKTPEFHYEAHKNTELLRHEAEWQDLMDYRTELVSASKDFHKAFITS